MCDCAKQRYTSQESWRTAVISMIQRTSAYDFEMPSRVCVCVFVCTCGLILCAFHATACVCVCVEGRRGVIRIGSK